MKRSDDPWSDMSLEECMDTLMETGRYFFNVLSTLEEGDRICFTIDIRRKKDGYSTATNWEEEYVN